MVLCSFYESRYLKENMKRRKRRPSPTESASDCEVGQEMFGGDGDFKFSFGFDDHLYVLMKNNDLQQ